MQAWMAWTRNFQLFRVSCELRHPGRCAKVEGLCPRSQNMLGEGNVLCQRQTLSESTCLKGNTIKQRNQKGSKYFQTEKNKIKLPRGELKWQRIRGLVSMREGGQREEWHTLARYNDIHWSRRGFSPFFIIQSTRASANAWIKALRISVEIDFRVSAACGNLVFTSVDFSWLIVSWEVIVLFFPAIQRSLEYLCFFTLS